MKTTRTLIDNWDTGKNFWTANPRLKVDFAEVYKKDKSVGKATSSKVMWFAAFMVDKASTMQDVPEKEQLIGKNLFNNGSFYEDNEVEILSLIALWKQHSWTKARYLMEKWERRMNKRDAFLEDQEYSFDSYVDGKLVKGTATDLDKMESYTPKLWSDYHKVMEDLERETLDGDTVGGAEESFLDNFQI